MNVQLNATSSSYDGYLEARWHLYWIKGAQLFVLVSGYVYYRQIKLYTQLSSPR